MSIMHCDIHEVNYDSDFVEDCFLCEEEEFEKDEIQEDTTTLEEKLEALEEIKNE